MKNKYIELIIQAFEFSSEELHLKNTAILCLSTQKEVKYYVKKSIYDKIIPI